MLSDFVSTTRYIHEEYLLRHANSPEPLDQPRHGLRHAIGETLIHLGERLVGVERPTFDEAA